MCVTNTAIRRPKALSLAGSKLTSRPETATGQNPRLNGSTSNSAPSASPAASIDFAEVFRRSFPAYGIAFHGIPRSVAGSSNPSHVEVEMPPKCQRPKRKRKPQKPGMTAKLNERHFVVHNYHDHATDLSLEFDLQEELAMKRKGGVAIPFPLKLHEMLDQIEADGLSHVISWQAHGRAFMVHDPKEFVSHVMPKYFKQTKLTSFQRQLNLYGFCRLTKGLDNRGYYHELFLRGMPCLSLKITRVKVKGTGYKAASSPEQEPDFYTMPPVLITPPDSGASDQDSMDSDEQTSTHNVDEVYAPNQVPSSLLTGPIVSFDERSSSSLMNAEPLSPIRMNIYVDHTPTTFRSDPMQSEQTRPVQSDETTDSAELVLDEAIEELFVEDNSERDTVEDFVETWGSSFSFDDLDTDCQLASFLEMLVAE
jgi:HSF-type DNA-binding